MTNDPKRWAFDESAPAGMRDYLRDVQADEPVLEDGARERIRVELARRVRSRGARGWALAGGLGMASAAALLFVLWPSEPQAYPAPAVEPEVIDGGPETSVELEPIRVERHCGEEDVNYECVVTATTERRYDRVALHFARGIAPPTCAGARVDAEPVQHESGLQLSVEAPRAYEAQRSYRACAYEGSTLRATGVLEGTRSVPRVDVAGSRGANGGASFALRFPLGGDIDDDVVSFVVLRQEHETESEQGYDATCEGEPVLEISRQLVRAFGQDVRVAVPHELELSPGGAASQHTFVVCARDAAGDLATSSDQTDRRNWPVHLEPRAPRVLTPSGEVDLEQLVVGHRVVTRGEPSRSATPGPSNPLAVSQVRQLDGTRGLTVLFSLRLADGRIAQVPSFVEVYSVERGDFVALDALSAADDSVLDVAGQSVHLEAIVEQPGYVSAYEPVLSHAGGFFIDSVLVGTRHARDTPLEPAPSVSDAYAEALPARADDCSVRATLDLGTLEAGVLGGASSIAIAFARHRGAPGTLQSVDCASARIGFEASIDALARIPVRSDGSRRLSVDMPSVPDEDDLDPSRDIECSTGYAIIACVRDESGLHALPAALGRWSESGPACFTGDTEILTPGGSLPLADLRAGMSIVAFDPETRERVVTRVERLVPRGERSTLALTLSSERVLHVTAEHPLFDRRAGRFRDARTFAVGDVLESEEGGEVRVIEVRDAHARERVFDLSVGAPHTYFANGVVAHNY